MESWRPGSWPSVWMRMQLTRRKPDEVMHGWWSMGRTGWASREKLEPKAPVAIGGFVANGYRQRKKPGFCLMLISTRFGKGLVNAY